MSLLRIPPFKKDGTEVKTRNSGDIITLFNDVWMKARNYAGSAAIALLKLNEDDEIDVGAALTTGPIEIVEDAGKVTLVNNNVSAAATASSEQSYTFKVDGDATVTIGAFADGVGGAACRFLKTSCAVFRKKNDMGAADYNPSALTSDHIITVDTTTAARSVIISTEDRDSGSPTNVREFIINDIAGNASVHNITISL